MNNYEANTRKSRIKCKGTEQNVRRQRQNHIEKNINDNHLDSDREEVEDSGEVRKDITGLKVLQDEKLKKNHYKFI